MPRRFGEKNTMQAIEFPEGIDRNQQIHLQLPKTISARKAKVIVMYEETTQPSNAVALELFTCTSPLSERGTIYSDQLAYTPNATTIYQPAVREIPA